MRRKLLAVVATAALVSVITPGAAQANHSWNGYHWARTSNPFTLKLGDNVDSNWNKSLNTTSSDWSASKVLNTKVVTGKTRPAQCDPTMGRVEVCNAKYGSTGWLGIASIWVTGGVHITQGTVKLNDTYFNTAQYDTQAWRNLVSCQEVGHTFGLDHQDSNFNNANLGTCMDYTNKPKSNQHPNRHDYNELETIYRHRDSINTVGKAAPGPSQTRVGNDARTWGRQVAGSRASGFSTYVRDLGHGNLVVTTVTWA